MSLLTINSVSTNSMDAHFERYIHGEDDDPDAPAINHVMIAFAIGLHNDFGGEIARSAAHGLNERSEVSCEGIGSVSKQSRTRNIVRLSTTLAKPKSATLTIGGSSLVKRTFYKHRQGGLKCRRKKIKPTSGFKSRCAMPLL